VWIENWISETPNGQNPLLTKFRMENWDHKWLNRDSSVKCLILLKLVYRVGPINSADHLIHSFYRLHRKNTITWWSSDKSTRQRVHSSRCSTSPARKSRSVHFRWTWPTPSSSTSRFRCVKRFKFWN